MATTRKNISASPYLFEFMEILRARNGYRKLSEYVQGLIRYHAQAPSEHTLSRQWAVLSPEEQCMLDAALLAQVKTGKGIRGSDIERRIDEAVKAARDAGNPEPAIADIAMQVGRSIAADAQRTDAQYCSSERTSCSFTAELVEAAELLLAAQKYRGFSEYVQGLARYDAQSQKPHALTSEWAAYSPAQSQLFDRRLLEGVKKGEKMRGTWFKAVIYKAIRKHYPPIEQSDEAA